MFDTITQRWDRMIANKQRVKVETPEPEKTTPKETHSAT